MADFFSLIILNILLLIYINMNISHTYNLNITYYFYQSFPEIKLWIRHLQGIYLQLYFSNILHVFYNIYINYKRDT